MKLSPQQLAAALGGDVSGGRVLAPGPGHSPIDRSLSVKIDSGAPDGFVAYSFAGDDPLACKDYVRERAGLGKWEPTRRPKVDSIARMSDRVRKPVAKAGSAPAQYIYRQADGTPYLRVVRPGFYQSHWNGNTWVTDAPKGPKIPYRLPELLAAEHDDVLIVEGEKDADNVAALGFTVTTSSGGAGKFTAELADYFKGLNVYILPDNDEAGARHAQQVAATLLGVAKSVRIVDIPGLPDKGDVSDWLDSGGTADDLGRMIEDAPVYSARDEREQRAEGRAPANDIVTEDNAAVLFVEQYGNDLRFCHSTGAWFRWQLTSWSQDRTGIAFQWARELNRRLAENQDERKRYITHKTAFASGVERFAKVDPQIAVTIDYWDRDPWLLGTPGGTVDLRTGELRDSERSDGITKTVAAAPDGGACPQWLRFLAEATGDDQDLVRFLQQWCGYCLTGVTREHALVFVYGPGGNGKTVFLNVVTMIMRDYATTAAMDTFTASHSDKHPTDLAMLRGARLVTASETEEGRAWAEAKSSR
jgi:putative DNA primase/helicase